MTVIEVTPQDVANIQETENIPQDLLTELKQFYKKNDPNLPGDWNFVLVGQNQSQNLSPKIQQVMTIIGGTLDNVTSAYLYGNYPASLQECNCQSGANCYENLQMNQFCNAGSERPSRDADSIAKGWLEGYEIALLYLNETKSYYWVKIPANLVVFYKCPPQIKEHKIVTGKNAVYIEMPVVPGFASSLSTSATVTYTDTTGNQKTATITFDPINATLPDPCTQITVKGHASLDNPKPGSKITINGMVNFERPDGVPGQKTAISGTATIPKNLADLTTVNATRNTLTGETTVTVRMNTGFTSSVPQQYYDPANGVGNFAGNVRFIIQIGDNSFVLGPTAPQDGKSLTMSTKTQNPYSLGIIKVEVEYSF